MKPLSEGHGRSGGTDADGHAFGKRRTASQDSEAEAPPESPFVERRRGGDRRKKSRRAPGGAHDGNSVENYREWAAALRGIAEMDRHSERQRLLLKIAADYARAAEVLAAIDSTAPAPDEL
jgi:hypothetical protein